MGFTLPPAFTGAVRSYRTISPLPRERGGIFSVALSVGSRPPGVTWHPVLRSPDFPLSRITQQMRIPDSDRPADLQREVWELARHISIATSTALLRIAICSAQFQHALIELVSR